MKYACPVIACAALFAAFAPATAVTIVHHEDTGGFQTTRIASDAPVGRLTVSSSQTISGFGIDVDLNGDSTLNFLIFDLDSSSLLYQSGSTSFVDNGAGYKYSNPFSFTFDPGTIYGLTAVSSAGGNYFVDFIGNSVGAFSFLTGNQNTLGTTVSLGNACCDVGTSLVVDAAGAVPEPATWAMMLVGFGGVGYAMRRHRKVAVSSG